MMALARHGVLAAGTMAAFLVFAAMIAVVRREPAAIVFMLTALLTIFAAGSVHLATRNRAARLDRVSSYALLVAIWVGLPIIAAIPIAATTPLGPVGSWFEAVAAFTTTGAAQVHDVADLPRSTLAWLLSLQWLGGLITLVGVVAVLAPAGIGGLPDRSARAIEHGSTESTALDDAIRHILPIYAGATVVCMLTLYAVGLRGFDAFGLASAALSTGGLLPDADGMSAYGSAAVKFVFMFFMLVGGTSILWHRMMLTRRFRLAFSQRENIAVLLVCLIVGILAAAVRFDTPEGSLSLPLALEDGLFSAISLITTTGVEPHAGAFSALPISLVTLLIFIGGATFSTSGGIKMYRVGVMGLQSLLELNRLIMPHAVRPRRLGRQTVSLEMMKAIWLCFAIASAVFVVLTAAVAPAMPSFEAAYVATLSALTNAGPIYAAGWDGSAAWPEWGALPAYAQIILALAMILGRLEILMVLGLIHFGFWRR
ncbi:TrkH family potassium uptake protein [Starkeya sp. ORNL1]|uniref:TrkH family potassium uptake protein n=1 Tax=Starkeya sp. ORNL1 TaxID=2709380 RepID=UPI001462A385|nr:TrkH family potassium uptake protein [Starkeya sp. ORNL1]QJP12802.1 TrkH family potassium uptake protein [Starkeya sp. ORNL1]